MQESEIQADPLLARGNVRARTANEMLRAFAHVRRFGHLVWLPIYAHHGTNDHLASIQVRCLSCDLGSWLTRALSLASTWLKSADKSCMVWPASTDMQWRQAPLQRIPAEWHISKFVHHAMSVLGLSFVA